MAATAHIPDSKLVDFAEGRAQPDPQAAAHLAGCAHCAGTLAWLARTIELMRADRAELPPAHVTARAKRLLRPAGRPAGLRQRLLAHLQFDSARAPLAFGIRSSASGPRQLMFDAGDYLVDLRLRAAGEHRALMGQVLGISQPGTALLSGPTARYESAIGRSISFTMPQVQPGTYNLTVVFDDLEITIPDLSIE